MATENTRSAGDTIRELTDSGREILEAGQRVATDLNDLEQRFRKAMDWRLQYTRHTVVVLAAAVLGGVLLGKAVT